LDDGEQREGRRVGLESIRGLHPDGAEGGAVRDRQDVRRDADTPDEPGSPSRGGHGGAGNLMHSSHGTPGRDLPCRAARPLGCLAHVGCCR